MQKPEVITLCGSTKFKEQFVEVNLKLTMLGIIVLSVGWFGHAEEHSLQPTGSQKELLDELHKRKIDLSDRIFVIDVDGYIGESTRGEIAYAEAKGLPVDYYTKFNFPDSLASG